jgi:NCAIR mutase (PurE)-related protein
MQTLNIYAHHSTGQQRKSLMGQGVPLDFIRDLETGNINIDQALKNVKSYVAADAETEFHTADIHCALAAIHFVIAKKEGHCQKMLDEIIKSFEQEMRLYFNNVSFIERRNLDQNLKKIVSMAYLN